MPWLSSRRPQMDDDLPYLFIDGNYANEIYRQAMRDVFGIDDEPDPRSLLRAIRFHRAYYYDCPTEKRSDEADPEYQARRDKQQAYFDEFKELQGVHVRLGTLRGRRARQKEVDVLLAVDMMTHGFNKTMSNAVLLTGDLDFRPVVDALVRNGIFVRIMYEAQSGSKELREAADYGIRLGWHQLYNWGRETFRSANRVPEVTMNAPEFLFQPVESGTIRQPATGRTSPVLLTRSGDTWQILIENWDGHRLGITHRDPQVLERYAGRLYASIEWTGRRIAK